MNKIIKLCIPLLALSCITSQAQTPIPLNNSGFENGAEEGWSIWVPSDSKEVNCHRALSNENPHSVAACLKLTADEISRFCVGPKQGFSVQAGERCRIGFWIRGKAEVAPGSPGFLARIQLSPVNSGNGTAGNGLYHLGLDGKVKVGVAANYSPGIPAQWTHVSGTIEIPEGVTKMGFGLFMVQAKGEAFLDDVSLEKMDASAPLSEVIP